MSCLHNLSYNGNILHLLGGAHAQIYTPIPPAPEINFVGCLFSQDLATEEDAHS